MTKRDKATSHAEFKKRTSEVPRSDAYAFPTGTAEIFAFRVADHDHIDRMGRFCAVSAASTGSFRKRIVSVISHGPDNSSKPEEKARAEHVDHFILEQIDTVPHLEALLLTWRRRPKTWSVDEMAAQLYVPTDQSARILRELTARGLLREADSGPGRYQYGSSEEQDRLVADVDAIYRRDLIRISRMIHAKAPSALRDFARAFRFTKEKE